MKTSITEIAPGVHQMVVGEGAHEGVYAPNVYLVVGSERAAIIDTAYGKDEEVEAYLATLAVAGSAGCRGDCPDAPTRRPHRRRGAAAGGDRWRGYLQ